ncbi:protein NYNRIN-like [Gossypium australe]|uniref:Protein NYNRIN-like n=1 Tax=Gossypium australe TaxID=47621 RepID=A0A5B6VJW7_9ROSI|nr:protein NYNRIN-like [Gossypium australe]
MVTLFHDMMHKEIEVYVYDMIVKSRTEMEHVQVLRKLFLRLRKFQLKLNPAKCTFGTRSRKLLGFVVSEKGIEIDPDNARAIQELPPPRLKKKKHDPGVWDEECQKTFYKVKHYLSNAPVLMPPSPNRPLILYLSVFENSMGCVLGQHDESVRKERAIYYLSKKFTDCETRYSPIKKLCCALIWITRRLRQYMYHTTWLISKLDPLRYMMESTTLNERMARWQILLSEFDIVYVNQKVVKGSAVVDFLVSRALEDYEPLNFDFPNEDLMYVAITKEDFQEGHSWKLRFDGASNAVENGIGAFLVSPNGDHYPFTSKLDFDCTNNMVEYEACILGIRAAIERKIKVLEVYDDSALVIYQFKGEWEMRSEIDQLPKNREYPDQATENDKRTLKRLAAKKILKEVYEGVCGTHANGFTMARQIMRFGYYWSTMEGDCISYAKKCHKCQIYGDKIHVPPSPLHVMTSPWPFSMWGMDVIGPILPKAFNGHRFIFVVINYFTKWVDATSYANVTKSAVSKFLKKEIICQYGMPERIISDNALNLNNSTIAEVCSQFKIKHHNSSPYRPKINGTVEAANNNIKKIVGKMTETYKYWHEKLPFALYTYQTSVRTSTGATLFYLVYGMEAVLPIEVEILSLRVLSELKLDEAEWIQS